MKTDYFLRPNNDPQTHFKVCVATASFVNVTVLYTIDWRKTPSIFKRRSYWSPKEPFACFLVVIYRGNKEVFCKVVAPNSKSFGHLDMTLFLVVFDILLILPYFSVYSEIVKALNIEYCNMNYRGSIYHAK